MHDVANRLEHDAIGKASPNSFWYFAARKQNQSETIGIIIWSFFNLDLIRNRWDKFENLLKKRISVHFSYIFNTWSLFFMHILCSITVTKTVWFLRYFVRFLIISYLLWGGGGIDNWLLRSDNWLGRLKCLSAKSFRHGQADKC